MDECVDSLKEHKDFKHALFYLNMSNAMSLTELNKTCMKTVERNFCSFIKDNTYVDVSLSCFEQIVSSTKLYITSEIEVFKAIDLWIRNNPDSRRVYAMKLLEKVRVSLLSEKTLVILLKGDNFCSASKQCKKYIRNVINNKENNYLSSSFIQIQSRYCDQTDFDTVICGLGTSNNYIEAYKTVESD